MHAHVHRHAFVYCICKIHLTEESILIRFHIMCGAVVLLCAGRKRRLGGGFQGGFPEEVALKQSHQELKKIATLGLQLRCSIFVCITKRHVLCNPAMGPA